MRAMKRRVDILVVLLLLIPMVVSAAEECTEFIGSECAELKWKFVPTGAGEVAAIVIAPSNPTIVYTGLENNAHAFYKSTDGGLTWKHLAGPGDHAKDIAVSPKDAAKAYVALSESVHSTDKSIISTSRSKWSPSGPGGDTIDILSSNRHPGPSTTSFSTLEVFAGDDKVMYAAIKGGRELIGFGDTNPEIFKTVDGGRTWQSIRPKVQEINVIAVHPQNHEMVYIGADDGIYQSFNSGQEVQKVQKYSDPVVSLEMHTENPNLIVAASYSEIFKSQDGGKNWKEITGPLEEIHRVMIAPSNPEILYAATFNGVFKSVDGGENWMDTSSNLKARNIQIVEIHPANPDIAFVGTSTLWSSARAEDRYRTGLYASQGIFKTVNGGNSWQKTDTGIFEYNIEDVSTNSGKAFEAWFAGQASMGAHKTEDAGQHWRLSQTPTFHYPMRIKFSLQNPHKVYATGWQEGGPFSVSEDGGINWKLIEGNIFFRGLNRGKHLYQPASGPATIHLHGLAVDPKDDNIVYAGSIYDANSPTQFPLKGVHLWKSTDGGESWKESDEGFPHEELTSIHDIIVDPVDSNVVYAATTEHESKKAIGIYKSTDAGKTWKAINNGLGNLDVSAIIIHPLRNKELLAATHGGLYKSTDAGNSWKKKQSASSFDVENTVDVKDVVYASTDEGVLKSKNFGNSWYKVSYGLPAGEGQGIGVDPTGKIVYAAVRDKGLYVARFSPVPEAYLPTQMGRERGFFDRKEPNFEDEEASTDASEESVGIPDFALEEECSKTTWPPSCSFISDERRRDICRKCKELKKEAGEEAPEKVEPSEENKIEKEGILSRILRFFRGLF